MNALRWQRMKGLYFNALELADESRPDFLEEACGEDRELRAEVERLLHAEGRLGDFLEHPDGGRLETEPCAVPASPLRRLDDFELLEEIGCGAMGRVFRARQESLGRTVAVKVMQPGLTLSTRQVEQFRLEATAAAKLRHPNIVSVHAVGEVGGVHYYAMDHINGPSLAQVLEGLRDERSRAKGPWHRRFLGGTTVGYSARVAQVVAELAEALQYSHEQSVLHRDVKPANVLLDEAGRPQLTDFGLAKDLELESLYHSGRVAGTPFYMSPEQARANAGRVDHRSDIFSLGVMLYELLTLERPFQGESSHEVFRAIQHAEPRRIRKLNQRVPADLETICAKAIEKEASRRYSTARDMAQDLRRFLSHESILARPPSPWLRLGRKLQRHRSRLYATALVVGALAVGAKASGWWESRSVFAAEVTRMEGPLTNANASLSELFDVRERFELMEEFELGGARMAMLAAELDQRIAAAGRAELNAGAVLLADGLRNPEPSRLGASLNAVADGIAGITQVGPALSGEEIAGAFEVVESLRPKVRLELHGGPAEISFAEFDCISGLLEPFEALEESAGGLLRLPFGVFRLRASSPLGGEAECTLVLDRMGMEQTVELWLRSEEEVTADMIRVPAGEFTFGSGPSGRPFYERRMELPAFWIDRNEVTNAEYRLFIEATGHPSPLVWPSDSYDPFWDERPVAGVTFHDAQAYAAWAGKRLPTLFEWQRAARGDNGALYPWGDEEGDLKGWSNVEREIGEQRTSHDTPENLGFMRDYYLAGVDLVGSHASDVSTFGVADLLGNLSEWTESVALTNQMDQSLRADPLSRMRAGRSFDMRPADLARPIQTPLGVTGADIGFRCAKSITP